MCVYPFYDWEKTVFLLSLDKTSAFSFELGIQDFYSAEIREAARDCIEDCLRTDDVSERTIVRKFKERLRSKIGEQAADKFEKWQNSVVSSYGNFNNYWSWMIVLSRLSSLWDVMVLDADLPLNNPEDTHLRIRLRDYLSHVNGIKLESELIDKSNISTWDKYIMESSGEFGCWETLLEVCHCMYAEKFWSRLLAELSPDRAQHLLKWARAFADVENLPVEDLSLPAKCGRSYASASAA